MRTLFVSLCLLVGCGSKTNPDVCCTDTADCAAKGVPDGSMCTDGLVCRGNTCIAETCTTSDQCEAGAPYCGASMLCSATCAEDSECPGFGGAAQETYCAMGACVECRADADCGTSAPVCDNGACRGCAADAECASKACGDNGACITSDAMLYVSPTGTDSGTCTQTAPCKTINFAVAAATPTRSHIVFAPGTYTERVLVDTNSTSASTLTIHGSGATWTVPQGGDNGLIELFGIGLHVRNVNFVANTSQSVMIQFGSVPSSVEKCSFSSGQAGIQMLGSILTVRDSQFVNMSNAIYVDGTLTMDRVSMRGGFKPIVDGTGMTQNHVAITNLVVYDQTDGLHLEHSMGSMSFSTLGDTVASGTALYCSSALTVDSSIIWNPPGTTVSGACVVRTSIVGPVALGTLSNSDPMFSNELQRDFHLTSASPAIDLVDSGPATDFDSLARPQGARFDVGAYEYKP